MDKKIKLYSVIVYISEGCCFIAFPDIVRSMYCSYISIDILLLLGLLLMVLWFGMQCVIVVFTDHIHFFFILIHSFFKNLHKSWIGVIVQFLEIIRNIDQHSLVDRGWQRDDG